MDPLEFAMQMERDGKAFYEKAAADAPNPEVRKILLTLAEEEERHYRIFRSLREGAMVAARSELDKRAETVSIARNLFQQMADKGEKTLYGEDARAVWKEAQKLEQKSEAMYREEADKAADTDRKELLNKIADEEKNHIYLVDNMLSFMADPQSFVDSAEYKNFMSWEGH